MTRGREKGVLFLLGTHSNCLIDASNSTISISLPPPKPPRTPNPCAFRHHNFAQETKIWLEKLSEGQVNHSAAIKTLQDRADVLERRANDHDKSIARAKELGMELQDAFAYVQQFSTTSNAPLPPPLATPSGQSAAAIVLVLKEYDGMFHDCN